MDFDESGMDEVTKVTYVFKGILARFSQEWI